MPTITSSLFLVVVITISHADRNINVCPAECAKYPNEEFAIDLYRCQNTCEQYGRTWDCPDYYKPKGDCYCKKGFARITKDGDCVSVTKNAKCAARLPITPKTCNKRGEIYVEKLNSRACDLGTCLTTQCAVFGDVSLKWSPHCVCPDNGKRLRNGTCVPVTDPLCIAEYQPSPERCAALGQIYQENAPCQKACDGQEFCPLENGDCICPADMVTSAFYWDYNVIIAVCLEEGSC